MSRLKLRAQEEDETEILLGPERLFVDLRASDPSILQSSSAKYYITLLSPRRQHLLVYTMRQDKQKPTSGSKRLLFAPVGTLYVSIASTSESHTMQPKTSLSG